MAKIIFEDGTILEGTLVDLDEEIDEIDELLAESDYLLDEE